ncbi:MAG TPA: BMP family ABC transporter substrate-binding protein [Bacillota bacterium]|nr:BMP family ABC transporter substrate-binding protein [Bacillota bacterium]HRX92337.1 BMP family ABC transporter substrate-binding protein [Candidatus Izemoplasmatales bacterium]
MKKTLLCLLTLFVSIGLFACNDTTGLTETTADDGILRVVLLVNGNLGDMSFFDSANEGIEELNAAYPGLIEATTIEMGTSQTTWETTLYRVSQQDYDLIICATTQMRESLQKVSKKYTDKHYIIFDSEIEDNHAADYPNVHSILFRQNEGGFLAGVLAASMANGTSGMSDPVTSSGIVGFIGGMRNDIIYDFAVGYAQGIIYENNLDASNVNLMNSFVGNFNDSTQAKALANVQYTAGADVIFACASQAGLGVIDSAQTNTKYVIGVDSDQYAYYADTNPTRANLIITSVLKKVNIVIYNSVVEYMAGNLEFGVLMSYGLSDEIIDLAMNENYEAKVPETLREKINTLKQQIISGELVVNSRYDYTLDEIDSLFSGLE